ncbi:hypothetical protein [Streptomyces sp. SID4985]|uniref:hypothetical protein n=1 Tax=unclassified Streptomyces TaxID=2593676 RepID=UPI00136BB4A1|nr:hypothetical protein [Streptomyces sp. SID4985]MYQ48010.1 hypothetical protein [Streptomyces sp. SID4985]
MTEAQHYDGMVVGTGAGADAGGGGIARPVARRSSVLRFGSGPAGSAPDAH